MEVANVNTYMMQFKDVIPSDKKEKLREALTNASDEKANNLSMVKIHNTGLVLFLSIFFGVLGFDRMAIGDVGIGLCKLLFGWITLGLWPLIDILACFDKAKRKNLDAILKALN